MAEKRYRAFFEGETFPGRDPETVRKDLARVLGLSLDEIERLFAGGRVLIADDLAKDQALELKTAFGRAGAFLVMESYEAEQASELLPDGFLEEAIDLSAPPGEAAPEACFPEPEAAPGRAFDGPPEPMPDLELAVDQEADGPAQALLPEADPGDPVSAAAPLLAGPKSFAAPEIPLELLQNALLSYASEAIDEKVLFLADLSAIGNAKTGLLVSRSHLYVKDLYGPVLRIPREEIAEARLTPGRNLRLEVNGATVLAGLPEALAGPLAAVAPALSLGPKDAGGPLSDEIPESWVASREKVSRAPSGLFTNSAAFRDFIRDRVFLGRLSDSEDNRMLKAMATGAAITAFAFAVMATLALVRNAGILWGLSPLRMAAAYGLFLAVIAATFRWRVPGFLISAVICAFLLLLLSGGRLTFTSMTLLMAVSPLLVGLAAGLGALLGASLGYVAWEFLKQRENGSQDS